MNKLLATLAILAITVVFAALFGGVFGGFAVALTGAASVSANVVVVFVGMFGATVGMWAAGEACDVLNLSSAAC